MPMSSGSNGSVPDNDLLTGTEPLFPDDIGIEFAPRSRKHPAASYFVVSTSHCHRKQQRVRFRVVIASAFILANEFLDEWTSGNFAIHRKNLPSSDLLCCSLKVFSRTGMDAAGWAYRRTET